jgi:magnesium transporter
MARISKKIFNVINNETYSDELKIKKITCTLNDKHPADIADLIEDLDSDSRKVFFKLTPHFVDSRVLVNLVNPYRTKTLAFFGLEHFRESVDLLEQDELIELVEQFNVKERKLFVEMLPQQMKDIVQFLMAYPENSVGRNMSFDFVLLPEGFSVEEALKYLKEKKEIPDSCSEIFTENDKHELTGLISLTRLLKSDKKKKLRDIESPDVVEISATDDQEVAHNLFNKYHFVRIPVVDKNGHMIGLIRSADLIDIAQEEITEDFNQLVGTEDDEINAPLLPSCVKRLRWLSVAVVNTLLSPFIISLFQDAIQQIVALAVLMPIAGALGGNIGIQTASVIIRAFSTEEFREEQYVKVIRHETLMGIFNGFVIGVLLGITALLWFNDWKLSLVLCGAMTFCATWASFIGVALPIVFYRFGYDSSLSSGPLITTITDVSGYIVFLGLARLFLC